LTDSVETVAVPPPDEQRAIAGALNDVNALLAKLNALITKKRDLKQAAMQQLLTGQTRLPGFKVNHGFNQTKVGLIPEEWVVKPLSSVLIKGRLGGNYPNQNREADHSLMKKGNIARGYMDTSKVEYIWSSLTPDPIHRLRYGDVLFNTRNTLDLVGKVAIWRDELPVAYYNSNLMRLEFDPHEVCSNEYANYTLNTAGAVARLRALATGTTSVAAIYTRDLLRMPFIVPPLAEQRAIATTLSNMDAEISALEAHRDKTLALKQGMMQELLTGRIRLVAAGERGGA
jgi:type I restriction enzyme, S subunit